MRHKQRIYLDYAASTPAHPDVLAAMQPHWSEIYGNASATHEYGRLASRALERARRQIADLLHAQPSEIIFAGCGSESDNLAVRGALLAARHRDGRNHLITSAIEHSAVLSTAMQLRDLFDFDLTILPVDAYGRVRPADVAAAIRPDTALISVMAANNEIGTLQPVCQIGQIARQHGVLFHTDAIQAAAVRDWHMDDLPVDMVSIAPHKFYGPKGVGVLFVRDGVDLVPILTGGGQEAGLRPGTSNVAFAVGAAKAMELAASEMGRRNAHYQKLRDLIIREMLAAFPDDCILTGHPAKRLPHNASFAFRHLSGSDLLTHLDMAGFAVSSGSACKSGDPKPSRVLQAIGLGPEWTKGGLRVTVGEHTSLTDVEKFLAAIPNVVAKMRMLNPR